MLTVSNYHYIRPSFETKFPSIFGVTPTNFHEQLLLLKKEGDFISPLELISNIDEVLKSKSNYFLISFDDGLKEQIDFALPILDTLKIPAIFFANSRNFEQKKVSTVHKIHLLRSIISSQEFIKLLSIHQETQLTKLEETQAKNIYRYDNNESARLKYLLNFKMNLDKQELIINEIFKIHFQEKLLVESLYMSKNDIIELAKKGYLGSHTHNHYPLGLLSQDAIKYELENSKLYFETITNSIIKMVSYPYGTDEACPVTVAETAKKFGYNLGFTTNRGTNNSNNNYLLLNRFDCNDLPGGKNYKLK